MSAVAKKTVPNTGGAYTAPPLKDSELQFFSEKISDLAGIALKSSKQDLIKTRLRTRLVELELKTYGEYKEYLLSLPKENDEWQIFVNLLTTNKTDFFREPKHFDHLIQKFLPEWLKTNEKILNVWSAASSTGEEAYTIAMILDRYIPKDRDFRILATDIDTSVVQFGKNAVYSKEKKPEIPVEYHQACLDFGRGSASQWFRIKSHLKEKVTFLQHNLIDKMAPTQLDFDVIFCRNVFIYFAPNSIETVAKKLYKSTKPKGLLFIGHSESFQGLTHDWKLIGPSILQKETRK